MNNTILCPARETLIDLIKRAEEQGYTQDEAIALLVKYNLVSDDPDDMD
ncbi:MAG: hypothetical protein HFJ35_02395 [Clostridia bacterium]|nr:hypothetical protein [Clostridia bacterium]